MTGFLSLASDTLVAREESDECYPFRTDEIFAVDDNGLSAVELAAAVVELSLVAQMVEVLAARKIKSLADRGGHHQLGYSSPTAFLVDQTGVSPGHARRVIGHGNAREKAPHAHAAWADGRLSTDQVSHLFRAAEAVPDEYPDAEERLVDIVEGLDAVDTGRAVEYWRQAMEGPGEIDVETQQLRRGLSASWTHGGMLRVDGWLTTAAGQSFMASLDANTPPPRDGDTRTPRQRRHDALRTCVGTGWTTAPPPPPAGRNHTWSSTPTSQRYRVLRGGSTKPRTGPIVDIDTLRMIACDCSVTRIVFGPDSEVSDVGRKTRVWSPAQRRAIIARDRHCQGPGCRAKPRHCDIHHEDHWANYGTTSVAKGKLFCRPCHIQEHLKERLRRRIRSRT